MIQIISGIPGTGKTYTTTREAIKIYELDNRLVNVYTFIYNFSKKYLDYEITNQNFLDEMRPHVRVYANYPILLDRKRNIYCNIIGFKDLQYIHDFKPGAVIIIDEVQMEYDSQEYRAFIKEQPLTPMWLQAHRHFDIDDVYFISQHPGRILNYIRILANQFTKVDKTINFSLKLFGKILIPGFKFIKYIDYYEFDDYGKRFVKDVSEFDCTVRRRFYSNRYYKHYDDKYLKTLVKDKPKFVEQVYQSLVMTLKEARATFRRVNENERILEEQKKEKAKKIAKAQNYEKKRKATFNKT